jgi:CRP/FNR family cyclic AMP-dependent transcriptional regulator
MELIQLVGYLAAFLMFSTFYMKKMIPLRAVGICSNVTFIIFAGSTGVYPLFILHICLLPLNTFRMIQMIKLVRRVKESYKGDLTMDFLIPFMKQESFKKGDVVFKKGESAGKMYCLRSGKARLTELGVDATIGEVVGEIGIFSPEKVRTASLKCETDAEFHSITDDHVLQLYYQNPEFGIHLLQLIIKRFSKDLEIKDEAIEYEHNNH